MHIQACTLIYNLARKREKCKTSGLEWVSIALHTQLSSSPPTFIAQPMFSWGWFLAFVNKLYFHLSFIRRKMSPHWKSFQIQRQSLALSGLPEVGRRSLRPRHKQLRYQNAFCYHRIEKPHYPLMKFCSGHHWCIIVVPHWAQTKRLKDLTKAAGKSETDHRLKPNFWSSVQSLKIH